MDELNKEPLELSEDNLEQVSGGKTINESENDLVGNNPVNLDGSQRCGCGKIMDCLDTTPV